MKRWVVAAAFACALPGCAGPGFRVSRAAGPWRATVPNAEVVVAPEQAFVVDPVPDGTPGICTITTAPWPALLEIRAERIGVSVAPHAEMIWAASALFPFERFAVGGR